MTTVALPLTQAPEQTALVDDSAVRNMMRAEVVYNEIRALVDRSDLVAYSGLGALLIAWSWLNREFFAEWEESVRLEGRPTHWQWIGLVLYGQFAEPLTHLCGILAERSKEKRRATVPTNFANAFSLGSPLLHHLSLVGLPLTLSVGGQPEAIEFVREGSEVHVRWGDHDACLWIASADDADLLTVTNVSTPVTDVIMRKTRMEVRAGHIESHLTMESLANILEELQLGKIDVYSREIESTSITTNAAHTVRFELLS